jgi:hypothetical protein
VVPEVVRQLLEVRLARGRRRCRVGRLESGQAELVVDDREAACEHRSDIGRDRVDGRRRQDREVHFEPIAKEHATFLEAADRCPLDEGQ